MRKWAVAAAVGVAVPCMAQVPDVEIKLNLYGNYRTDRDGRITTRLYDTLGHLSTVGLLVKTDLGVQAFVAQKLQLVPHGGDPDELDQYYFESPGNWRVGKQYLPFGQNGLLNESALAVRSNWTIPNLEVPIHVAACDAGPKRQQGVVGRIGDNFGVSVAIGEDFGIASTSFDVIRLPTQAPDVGHGFHQIYGLDFASRTDQWQYRGEIAALRAPQTQFDQTDVIGDVSVTWDPGKFCGYQAGLSYSARQQAEYVRFQLFLHVHQRVSIEPMLRIKNTSFYDFSVALHVKL